MIGVSQEKNINNGEKCRDFAYIVIHVVKHFVFLGKLLKKIIAFYFCLCYNCNEIIDGG